MQVRVLRDELVLGLVKALRAAVPKPDFPAQGHVLLRTGAGVLVLTGTDRDRAISTPVEARVEAEGACCAPRRFVEFVKTLAPEPVTLRLKGGRLHGSAGGVSATFPTLPADEFPAVAELPREDAPRCVALDGDALRWCGCGSPPARTPKGTRCCAACCSALTGRRYGCMRPTGSA